MSDKIAFLVVMLVGEDFYKIAIQTKTDVISISDLEFYNETDVRSKINQLLPDRFSKGKICEITRLDLMRDFYVF